MNKITISNQINRILFIFSPWYTKPLIGKGEWISFRNFLIRYRSNPRDLGYMLNLLDDFIHTNSLEKTTKDILVLETYLNEFSQKTINSFDNIVTSLEEIKIKNYQIIVLMYSDALGFGFERIENYLKNKISNNTKIIVINGRKRVFLLDNETHKAIRFRRFLAKTWLFESIFGVVVILCAILFFIHDALMGYNKKN